MIPRKIQNWLSDIERKALDQPIHIALPVTVFLALVYIGILFMWLAVVFFALMAVSYVFTWIGLYLFNPMWLICIPAAYMGYTVTAVIRS